MKYKKSLKVFLILNFVDFIKEMCRMNSRWKGVNKPSPSDSPEMHIYKKRTNARFRFLEIGLATPWTYVTPSPSPFHPSLLPASPVHSSPFPAPHLFISFPAKKSYVRGRNDCYRLDIPYPFSFCTPSLLIEFWKISKKKMLENSVRRYNKISGEDEGSRLQEKGVSMRWN